MVLVPAGVTSKSLSIILQADLGFRADHVLTAQMSLPAVKYAKNAQRLAFYNQLLERLRSLRKWNQWERASTFRSAIVQVGWSSGLRAARSLRLGQYPQP